MLAVRTREVIEKTNTHYRLTPEMQLRRLTTSNTDLLRLAYSWDANHPRWYREMDAVFNCGTVDDFIARIDDPRNAFIGVFDNHSLQAVIVIVLIDYGVFEGHLCTAPHADTALVTWAIRSLLHDLLAYELTQAFCWVAEKNTSVRRICVKLDMQPDGAVMWKGSYHGKAIRWLRHSIKREQLATAIAA